MIFARVAEINQRGDAHNIIGVKKTMASKGGVEKRSKELCSNMLHVVYIIPLIYVRVCVFYKH
jgi:hypothetical protein